MNIKTSVPENILYYRRQKYFDWGNIHSFKRNYINPESIPKKYNFTFHFDNTRQTIYDFIELHPEIYGAYLPSEIEFPTYISRGRQDGTWGDSLEINVFSQIFECEIHIFHYSDQPLAIFKAQEDRGSVFKVNLFQVRQRVYGLVLERDPGLESLIRLREQWRIGNQELPLLSLMYTNGNHYDAIVAMSNEELGGFYRELMRQV